MGSFSEGLRAGSDVRRTSETIANERRARAQNEAVLASQGDFLSSLEGAIPTPQGAAPVAGAIPAAQAPTAQAYPAGNPQAAPAEPPAPDQSVPPQMATPGQPAQQPPGWHNPPGGFGQFHVSKVPPTVQGAVDDFGTHLHDHALDTNGQPNHTAGVTPTPQAALASAANDPNANAGIPEDSPQASKQPHSLTPDFWDESDRKIMQAAHVAANNGHDPSQVMDSLQKIRIGFVQSHVMRNLTAANVAMMNGDNSAVEKALRNVNYYLPDGADLKLRKSGGQIMYQDPIQPYLDADGNPTDVRSKKENYIPVDASHLQMLGQAVLDPMKVNDLITGARAAAGKAKLDAAKAYNETLTAQGALATGTAALTNAQSTRMKAASAIYKDTSQGALNEAHAKYYDNFIDLKIKQAGAAGDKLAYEAGNAAATAVYNLAQGQPTTVPVTDKEGNPSLSPAAGKSMRDPTKMQPELAGKPPEFIHSVAALAGEIGAGNRGRIPAEQAAQIAIRVLNGLKKTHLGPDGKPAGDVKIAADRTQGWYWNGTSWTPFKLAPQTGGILASGQTDVIPSPSAEEGESSDGENPPDDDNAPE